MQTPGPTPSQTQLPQNEFGQHLGYGSSSGSLGHRSASMAALMRNSSASETPSRELPVPAKPTSLCPDILQGMRQFERVLSEEMLRHSQGVMIRLSGLLASELRRSRHEHRPMAIRLMYLGKDEASVRPCIVVFCPELVQKRAEKFFKKEVNRRIYQSDEPGRENFQVVVIGQPPRPRATKYAASQFASRVKVASAHPAFPHSTSCSLQVKAEHEGVSRLATVGGFIIASCHDGTETIYGLTAGHIFPQTGYSSSASDEPWDGSMPSPASSNSEDDGDITSEEIDQSYSRSTLESSVIAMGEPAWIDLKLADVSFSREARDKDWALVEGLRLHQIVPSITRAWDDQIALGTIGEQQSLRIGFDTEVALECVLSQTPSMILTPSGHNFVQAHLLIPDASRRLQDGASGTWVTSQSTPLLLDWLGSPMKPAIPPSTSVYGQIVADDIFGDIYMIPLHSIMDDIKTLMDAAIVRLPKSKSELWRVLNNQLHEEHAHTESKTDSFSPIDEKEFEIDSNNLDTPMTNDKAKQKNEVPVSVGPDDYPSALKSSERPPFSGFEGSKIVHTDNAPRQDSPPVSRDSEDNDNGYSSENAPRSKKRRIDGPSTSKYLLFAPWTTKEDLCLKRMRDNGESWDRIMEDFTNRSENDVKRRWYRDLLAEHVAEAEGKTVAEVNAPYARATLALSNQVPGVFEFPLSDDQQEAHPETDTRHLTQAGLWSVPEHGK